MSPAGPERAAAASDGGSALSSPRGFWQNGHRHFIGDDPIGLFLRKAWYIDLDACTLPDGKGGGQRGGFKRDFLGAVDAANLDVVCKDRPAQRCFDNVEDRLCHSVTCPSSASA